MRVQIIMVSMLYLVRASLTSYPPTITLLTLCLQLYSARQRGGNFERSDLMIRRLIRLTVETGSACAFSATLELIFFLALPNTNAHLAVYAHSHVLSKYWYS